MRFIWRHDVSSQALVNKTAVCAITHLVPNYYFVDEGWYFFIVDL